MRTKIILVVVLSCTLVLSVQAQTGTSQARVADETLIAKLPESLRERGRALLAEADETKRAQLAREFVRLPGTDGIDFLLGVLATDTSSRVRFEILDRLGRLTDARVRAVLPQIASSDPDTRLALLALEQLRSQQARELARLLNQRLEKARAAGNAEDLRKLANEQERWISLVRGTMLPSFMRTPPPLFSLKRADEPVRILAFGDFGTGSDAQKQTAAAMVRYHRQTPFDFGVTLGDNFYSVGMESPTDPRWKTQWENLYDPLGIKIYATYGNHDWGLADSPAAELIYAGMSASWRMPAPYYTFTAGSVQLFAVDTNEVSEAQLLWLKEQLEKSTATWKLVYGHHPIYSHGQHGDNAVLIAKLLPVLKGRADVFLAGHDHDLQHLKAEDGVHFFVSGGGGAGIRPITPGSRSIFAMSSYAFSVIDADSREFTIKYFDPTLKELYRATLRKSGNVAVLGDASR
jgi:predicted MPP superfamily phosphohydrolase